MHDQIFKSLLERFFGDFVRIVLPDESSELRLDRIELHRKEHFTDVDRGRRRLLDVVAEVPTVGGEPEAVLVHVEIEARARGPAIGLRMWRYAMVLRLRHRKPVAAIVLYVRGGLAGARWLSVDERLGRRLLGRYRYIAFGLSKCAATEYLARPEALAPALAALMDRGALPAAEHKFRCLRRIASLRIDEAARYLLVNCVESYLQLTGKDREEYAKLLADEPSQEVRTMQMTYAEKIEAQGVERGIEKGIERGIEQGRAEGMRALLAALLERRFGPLTEEAEKRLLAISSPEDLTRLHERALEAASLDDLDL